MAEIGPLLLPPPAFASGRSVTPARNVAGGGPGRQNGEDSAYLATVDAAADSTSGGAKAKQFRFRVVDGGRSDTLGNAGVPTNNRESAATNDTRQAALQATLGRDKAATGSTALPLGTFSAPFLAQLIAQEQLKPGLYDPPVKQADLAYRQAGAEPPLHVGDNGTGRFKIAV